MKRIVSICIVIISSITLYGQGITITGSGQLIVKEDAYLDLVKNGSFLTEKSGTNIPVIEIDGNLNLGGNWTNNNNNTLDLSAQSGIIKFNGTTPQLIAGNSLTIFPKIEIDNQVLLGIHTHIGTSINFISNDIVLGNFDLKILNGAQLLNYSSSNNVVTSGSGDLIQYLNSGGSQVTFPVSTETSYTPAYITQNTGNSSYFYVRLLDGVWSNGTSGTNLALTDPVVNRTWLIESDETPDADIILQWNGLDEVNGFDRNSSFGADYSDGWQQNTTVVSGSDPYMVTFTDVESLDSDHPHTLSDENEPLSIDLLYFYAHYVDNDKVIKWASLSERNSESYLLYVSTDMSNWSQIFNTAASIHSNTLQEYQTIDNEHYNSTFIYYKLMERETDGELKQLGIIKLTNSSPQTKLETYYIHQNQLIIQFNSYSYDAIDINLYNSIGQLISEESHCCAGKFMLDMSHCQKGVYFINIRFKDGNTENVKLLF